MWGRILKTPKTKKHHQHDLVFYHSWWWMRRTPCLLPYQRQQWCCSRWWTMHTMHSFYAFRHLTHTVNRCHYSFLLNTWDLKRKTYVLSFYWQNLLFCNCPPPPSPQLNPAFASLLPITNLCIHLPLILSIFSPIIQPAQHDIPINHYRSVHPPGFVWFWDTTWWKCVAYRETRAVLLSDEKPVQCRANAPLVVDTQKMLFLILVYHQSSLTCYITLTHDFPPLTSLSCFV